MEKAHGGVKEAPWTVAALDRCVTLIAGTVALEEAEGLRA